MSNLPKKIESEETLPLERDVSDDYELSRDTYKELIEAGKAGLEGMAMLAQESEHPRAYEVLATLIKQTADVTDKLMDLQKKKVEIQKPISNSPNNNNANGADGVAVMLTGPELQEMLAKGIQENLPEMKVIDNKDEPED